ncbi:MAG TPA: PAS domain S-box protein [Smithella sp.]|nr:PAS domain S-box protein [Smithella sp.]MDM7985919.1 PAS domain S-box protein [Smithella sp.]HNY50792.1 PAS domain S-box protein [Smithella sp.]HOG90726.1 PAS domain S-box protein [Smithella sp.]HOU50875.1 PAS domain S-box protein [Smithella sp.]
MKSRRQKDIEKYRSFFDNIHDGCFETDLAGNFIFFNDSVCRLVGYSREELMKMNVRQLADKETLEKVFAVVKQVQITGKPVKDFGWQVIRKDGAIRYIEGSISLQSDVSGNPAGFFVIVNDVTEHKQAQQDLIDSEEKFRVLAEATPTAIALFQDNRWIYANRAAELMCGYSIEELRQMNFWDIVHPDHKALTIERGLRRQRGEDVPGRYEFKIITKDGTEKWVDFSGASTMLKGRPAAIINVIDITDRKQMEEKYRNIFENAQEGIYQSTPEGKFILANQSMARILGYDSPEDLISSINDIARQVYVDYEDRVKFIKTMEDQNVTKNNEVRFYKKDGSIIWVSRTMHSVRNEKGQVLYYEGIVEDITEKKDSVERLRDALGGTVRAIASLVETRDPYTAGHQRQVADLARAIAAELGLSRDRIEGLRVAAIIHDIGKVSVPAEILSKPSKLTKIEFDLIKTHAQAGFDILKDIDFPWPVARIVLEHHERMNGSGYPRHLKGDDILIESRILSVADVVEAMGSHRPYRPALGIEPALEEIEHNKGILYDSAVSDACLKLFREKGYQLT